MLVFPLDVRLLGRNPVHSLSRRLAAHPTPGNEAAFRPTLPPTGEPPSLPHRSSCARPQRSRYRLAGRYCG